MVKIYKLPVVVEKDKHGYFVYCPAIQGCYTQGKTYEEALKNIREVIKLHLEEMRANRETIPQPELTSLTSIEVAI